MKLIYALVPAFVVVSNPALADAVPKLNVEPSCRGAIANIGAENQRDVPACMKDENEAKADLDKNWNNYPSADRSRCTRASTMGGQPSYVELLVCLEMIQYAKSGPAPAFEPKKPTPAITPSKQQQRNAH